MSWENVKIVEQAVEAFNEVGMVASAMRFFDPAAVFVEPPDNRSEGAEGRDAAIQTFAQFDATWEEHRSETEEIRVIDEERVLVLSIEHFRVATGSRFPSRAGTSYTLRDGKIVRLQSFWERENALEAAELSKELVRPRVPCARSSRRSANSSRSSRRPSRASTKMRSSRHPGAGGRRASLRPSC